MPLLICGGAAFALLNNVINRPPDPAGSVIAAEDATEVPEVLVNLTPAVTEPSPTETVTAVPELIEPLTPPATEPLAADTATAVPEVTRTITPDAPPAMITDEQGHRMVLVPAGQSLMGTGADLGYAECQTLLYNETCERSWFVDEEPVHTVNLDAFYLDQYEISNEQFARFINEFGNQSEAGALWLDTDDEDVRIRQIGGVWTADPGYGSHPVVEINWYAAGAYCRWRDGRLPTEAEWEKAARGTDERLYAWGSSYDDSRANMCDANCDLDWANPFYNDGYGTTAPVGSYPAGASPYGAYDMSGNVMEWTLDWYAPDSYAAPPADNPQGAASGEFRVTRGGSWVRNGRSIRVSYRYSFAPADGTGDVGFRCIMESGE